MGCSFSLSGRYEPQNKCIIPYVKRPVSRTMSSVYSLQAYEANIESEPITIIEGEISEYPAWRWPESKVPYLIDPSLYSCREILKKLYTAIHIFNTNTPIQLQELLPRNRYSHYITFTYHKTLCNSYVGRSFPGQPINLPDSAEVGNIMHEIMHALGFQHEYVRTDREEYVSVNLSSMSEDIRHNYLMDGYPIGKYDPNSIMHYPTNQDRSYFSDTDLKALKYIYEAPKCSYEIFGEEYFLQSYHECITCWEEGSCYGVCQYCSITCHRGHIKKPHSIQEVANLNVTFVCDCGRYGHELMLCTRTSTNKKYVEQRMLICRTCFDVEGYRKKKYGRSPGVCYPCSLKCHLGHVLEDQGIQKFFCGCGMSYCGLETGCQAILDNLS